MKFDKIKLSSVMLKLHCKKLRTFSELLQIKMKFDANEMKMCLIQERHVQRHANGVQDLLTLKSKI